MLYSFTKVYMYYQKTHYIPIGCHDPAEFVRKRRACGCIFCSTRFCALDRWVCSYCYSYVSFTTINQYRHHIVDGWRENPALTMMIDDSGCWWKMMMINSQVMGVDTSRLWALLGTYASDQPMPAQKLTLLPLCSTARFWLGSSLISGTVSEGRDFTAIRWSKNINQSF